MYPKLFTGPPARDLAHAVSRISVLALVASAIFQVASGVLNIARWYQPLGFFFTVAHYWTAWIAIGALTVHIGAQLVVVRRALRRPADPPAIPAKASASLGAVWLAIAAIALLREWAQRREPPR